MELDTSNYTRRGAFQETEPTLDGTGQIEGERDEPLERPSNFHSPIVMYCTSSLETEKMTKRVQFSE